MTSPSRIQPYFLRNNHDKWNRKQFLDEHGKPYQWKESLTQIANEDTSDNPILARQKSKAITLLDQEALRYFVDIEPGRWSRDDFVNKTDRKELWDWARREHLRTLTESNTPEATTELIELQRRCFDLPSAKPIAADLSAKPTSPKSSAKPPASVFSTSL